ncbi:MAG TPA: hypothetical protein RMI62_04100, partial [Polyangiaceae bacterium LLY-WYZ-15_(1-7)]|nr:hypothetical protein [Polyangiaceae bacterium LLY-WYZ-15_(1-7)]
MPAIIVYVASLIAIGCLLALLHTTSHQLERTNPSSAPVPPPVFEALTGQAKMPTRNIDDEDGRTYCVRCLLWRPANVPSHHCKVCNRCCAPFDHHCHILGRCI